MATENENEQAEDSDPLLELDLLSELAGVSDRSGDAEVIGLVAPAWLKSVSCPREFVCFHDTVESPDATRPCFLMKVTGILAPGAAGSVSRIEFIVTDGETIVVPRIAEAVNWDEARAALDLPADAVVPPAVHRYWVIAWHNGLPSSPAYDYGYRLRADGLEAILEAIRKWANECAG